MSEFFQFLVTYQEAIWWLVAAVVLIGIEAATVQMVSVWLAVGALASMVAAMLHASLLVQFLVFTIVSAITLALTRSFVKKVLNVKKVPTNADSVIGLCGTVTEEINNLAQTGKVFVNGLTWTARTMHNEVVPQGATVMVDGIEGVKVIVEPVNETAAETVQV
ncbi:MAG: NfeD family protein [Angelakisella sp.]|nr:NfeD family protein [Angelakisella sp.]